MKDYSKKLSIVISVHTRQYYLDRVCEYYKDLIHDYSIQIHIIDSSDEPWENHTKYPEFNYTYFGPEKNFQKMPSTLRKLNTEYFLIAPDDDFYVKRSIIQCLEFLLKNPDYSAAHGEFLRFDSRLGELVDLAYGRSNYKLFTENNYHFEKASDRILNYFDVKRFLMINHSINKRKVWLDIFNIRFDKKNKHLLPYRFSDQHQAILILLEGNVKVLPCLYALRDVDRLLSKGRVDKSRKPDVTFDAFPDAILSKENPYAPLLAKKDKISLEKASFILGLAIQKLISGRLYRKYMPSVKITESFPSQTGEYKADIEEVMGLVRKYRDSIPGSDQARQTQGKKHTLKKIIKAIFKKVFGRK
ncbi:MAG: TIGR00180 family glycosyltransferase [Leptospirales bacterium]